MDKFSLYVPNFLSCKEYFVPEKNNACPGCGLALAVRHAYKTLENEIAHATWQRLTGKGARDIFGVGKTEVTFLAIPKKQGDLVLCFDNEAGGTLPETLEKPMVSVAVAEGFSYVATACPSYPFDLYDKVKRGFETKGNAYVHMLCPCPQGWQFDADLTVKIGLWAVESRVFPLYEVLGGMYHLTLTTPAPRSIAEYLKVQRRFESLSEQQIQNAQVVVSQGYNKLVEAVQRYLETTGASAVS